MRKTVGRLNAPPETTPSGELDVERLARVVVTSEDAHHPIENAFDRHRGPGGTEWVAAEPGAQSITVVFDEPQNVQSISIEIEEKVFARTQEIEVATGAGDGDVFQVLVRQEYNFSPPNTSFEREKWTVGRAGVSRVRISIRPDKGAAHDARARLTALAIYTS
jgi:hypothetical protein